MTHPQLDRHFIELQEALAGKYSLDMEIGRGGMGVVYLARDVRLDRPVALKVLPERLAARNDVRERFIREARTAAKLSHPNIVAIHAVDEIGEFVFFVMSYIAGETLGERVRRRGPVPPSECMRILREVGWALSYAHGQGVIHRDIKPDNILLEEGSGRALVADFGIAGLTEDGRPMGAGEIIGTAEFMSPEQAAGIAVDARTDIYALGMVAYYILSGELPYRGTSAEETLELVKHGAMTPLNTVAKTAPRRLTRIIETCLKRHIEERFASADKLAEAVDSVATSKKQIPVAVRTFLYDPIDLGGDAAAYAAVGTMSTFPMFLALLTAPSIGGPLLAAYLAYFLGAPALVVPPRIRRLLNSGNTVADLEVGLKQDLEQRREEVPLKAATRMQRIKGAMRKWGLIGAAGSWTTLWLVLLAETLGLAQMTSLDDLLGFIMLVMTGSVGSYLLGRLGTGSDKEGQDLKKAERRLKFWQGKLGRWLFKACGIGLHHKVTTVRATHRPTELQIGMAAEALFEALPKETRKGLGDVPAMLLRLESDASTLRTSIDKLNEAEAAGLPHNLQLPADLKEIRERAEERLSDVVAALETIRLGLLRLSAGGGTVESLTTHLHAASEVGGQVSLLMQGINEVEAALASTGDFGIDTPTTIPSR